MVLVESEVRNSIKKFVVGTFLLSDDMSAISDVSSFLEEGIVDSTGILELVGYVEVEFGIKVLDNEITPENFDSVQRVCSYLMKKQ